LSKETQIRLLSEEINQSTDSVLFDNQFVNAAITQLLGTTHAQFWMA
jgi:hypothetical protein